LFFEANRIEEIYCHLRSSWKEDDETHN
jgi:hypothetical protein